MDDAERTVRLMFCPEHYEAEEPESKKFLTIFIPQSCNDAIPPTSHATLE